MSSAKSEIGKLKPRFNIEHVEKSKTPLDSPASHHNRSFETVNKQSSLSFCQRKDLAEIREEENTAKSLYLSEIKKNESLKDLLEQDPPLSATSGSKSSLL